MGLRPLVRPLAHEYWGKARTWGTALPVFAGHRRGKASPHIRRRSRIKRIFEAKPRRYRKQLVRSSIDLRTHLLCAEWDDCQAVARLSAKTPRLLISRETSVTHEKCRGAGRQIFLNLTEDCADRNLAETAASY